MGDTWAGVEVAHEWVGQYGGVGTRSKVTVIGAGSVGSSVAYAALIRGIGDDIVLYDLNAAKVTAEVLDLAHGAQFTRGTVTGGDDLDLTAGSDVIVITAGAKQHPGQTRLALAGANQRMMADLMPALVARSPEAIVIVVTNPCDVLASLAQRSTGLPPERVFASGTVLDTSRLRWLVANRANVAPQSVHADMLGEHGDSEFPVWSSATIGHVPLREWGDGMFDADVLDDLAQQVRTAAYRVIEGKGATNYAIGLSAARIVEAVLRDERAVLPVSCVLGDFRDMGDVALSVPCVVGAFGARPIPQLHLSPAEEVQLDASAEAIRAVLRDLA